MPARHTSWLKLYYHVKNDAVLNALPDDEFRVWFKLLIHAADRDERRGAFRDDAALALEVAGGDRDLLHRALARLVDYGHLEIEEEPNWYCFPGFAEEQRRKPSDEPAAIKQRVRKHREKRRAEAAAGNALPGVSSGGAPNETAGGVSGAFPETASNTRKRVTRVSPASGNGKSSTVVTPGNAIRIRERYRTREEEEEEEEAAAAARNPATPRNGVTRGDGRDEAEAALVAILTGIAGFPPDEGAGTTRLAREYLAAFPDVDVLAVARDYAGADLNHPPAWPRFKGWLKQERERVAAAAEQATLRRATGTNGHRPSRDARLVAAAKTWRPPPEHPEGR